MKKIQLSDEERYVVSMVLGRVKDTLSRFGELECTDSLVIALRPHEVAALTRAVKKI